MLHQDLSLESLLKSAELLSDEIEGILSRRYQFLPKRSLRPVDDEFFGEGFYRPEVIGDYQCRWVRGNAEDAYVYLPLLRKSDLTITLYGRMVEGLNPDVLSLSLDYEPVAFEVDERDEGALVISLPVARLSNNLTTILGVHNPKMQFTQHSDRKLFFCFEALNVE
ncbi:MAG: hypothetical protein MK080_01720 [Opitutales bacterium]|nr:hypothetical protein [Opitutales bacterium]